MKELPNYLGHRLRVRKKFLSSLGEELHDYELLEILLFAASSRKDTKAIAKKLIAKFSDISGIINADLDSLKSIEGVGEAAIVQIKIIAKIIQRILKNNAAKKPVLNNWQLLLDYASASLKNLNHEIFRVLFLDKRHQLIEDEIFTIGENDHVHISKKNIAKKALILQAASVILLHNHPAGEARPSTSDIKTTNEISAVLNKLEIKILDHLIIAKNSYFSFKEEGLL